jgi:hypothetical protein
VKFSNQENPIEIKPIAKAGSGTTAKTDETAAQNAVEKPNSVEKLVDGNADTWYVNDVQEDDEQVHEAASYTSSTYRNHCVTFTWDTVQTIDCMTLMASAKADVDPPSNFSLYACVGKEGEEQQLLVAELQTLSKGAARKLALVPH